MSFSNLLKNAQATNAKAQTLMASPAPASVMTLSLENEPVETLIEAYSGDEYIRLDGYDWYEDFEDNNYSTVDKNKNITVDPSQVNITQETNSQFIPFKISRYWDGIDLINMRLWIHYVNNVVDELIPPVNVQYNSEFITFGWLVEGNATQIAGALEFEIIADGTIKSSSNVKKQYTWRTKPNGKLNIIEALKCRGEHIDTTLEDWTTTVLNPMSTMLLNAQKAAEEAKQSAIDAEDAAKNVNEIIINDAVTKAIAQADTKYATIGNFNTLSNTVDLKADKNTVDTLNDTVNTKANQSDLNTTNANLSNLQGYVGILPEGITSTNVVGYVQEVLLKYYTKEQVDKLFEDFDISDQLEGIEGRVKTLEDDFASFDGLAALSISYDEDTNTLSFFNGETKIKDIVLDVTSDIATALEPVNADLQSIHETIDDLPTTLEFDYYTKTATDGLLANKANSSELATVKATADTNKTDIGTLSTTVAGLSEELSNIDKSPVGVYDISYEDNKFSLLYGDDADSLTPKTTVTITGGSGGGSTSSSLKITYVTTSPVIATVNDKVLIKYNFSGTDSSGDIVTEGNYTWKIGSKIIASGIATNGENTFDATDFATTTSQKFVLSITDDNGSLVTKSWTVQKVDVRLVSTFRDVDDYTGEVSFNYTPYGAIEKDIHFILDGKELGTVKTSSSGIPTEYKIPAQTHGSHLLDVYMTATINNTLIESNHVYKDIIWCDEESNIPVIGCATPTINVIQYDTVNVKYVVIDPNTETPKVTWYVGEEIVSEETLTEKDDYGYYTFPYKANTSGTFVLKAVCGESEPKIITVNVEKLSIDVSPVTSGLEFDFNPVGYSNSSANRLWSYNDVSMTVSDNFDWVNGGYQIDENGDQYFCVKAGTNAIINYNLFADDPKKNGKEFKVIFRTKNIRKRDTSFLTCMDYGIGLDMKVEHATVYNSGGSLKSNYCEDTIIEYEFNINKDTDMMIVMTYEDGTPGKPYEYTETSSFKQTTAQPITIGSSNCDVHIYRMKAYSVSLTDTDIKNNFIADARNATEMIARYNRNQIYTNGALITTSASGDFNVDALMKAAPDLRYIFLEVPQFTNDKDNKIDDCTVYFRYPNGKRPHDNWTCTGMRHRGQGTSSNLYGYAGRNIDLCMDRSSSLFTWVDEEGNEQTSSTITLTDTSYPTDYLNIKVNIASSENTNNEQMARRFNEFQPFLRYARKKDSRIKDTMEFYNCVVFIRETSTDETVEHREFNDTNWHFYAIGNVGDSKKTDDTRVNNAQDPKEHVIEITDADKPLCGFQTGKENNAICPVSEWTTGNTAYDILHSTEYVYDEEGEFESFGGKTFEFRYEMEDITEEQREVNINSWRDLYKFIVTSTDEEFYAHLKDYFVVDSALYFYLFTERYTMVDNRAKNSFWHYGKIYISNAEATALGETESSYYIIDDEAAAINDGYRYDLTFGYDMDTCLGIDNTGDYVFSYGKEDTDYYVDGDPSSDYVFRVANSVFFCRLRDLFPTEMQAMFKDREEKGAWNSNSLITQWDNSQAQFPEELWRLDYERKYYRTYLGLSIDNSIPKGIDKTFLIGKFFGRKKYSRRSFETNQEMYFATKYFGNKALSDVFWIRGNVPIGSSIKPNYSLTLVPYSDMYVCVQYTSTGTPIHQKVKAGETCYFENDAERLDFIYVYAASYIQEVGDLSRCYVGDNNFSSAIRLQRLEIGSTDEGYENTFMKEVLVENNPLLEYLDLRNISGINSVINVSGCSNLKELYAEGTNATGVIFANGGLLETAHLPNIESLSMKNLNYIKDFAVNSYANLHTLIVENVPNFNTYEIITSNPEPPLRSVRLIGINWDETYGIKDGTIFDKLLTIGGRDSSNHETDISVLTGTAHINIMKQQQDVNYKKAWSDLYIGWNTFVEQFPVTFVNDDGKVLEVQYVDKGESAIDPTTRTENRLIPTKESDDQYDYTFAGWDNVLTNIFSARTIKATYSHTIRRYTVEYMAKNENGTFVPWQTTTANYGEIVSYTGSIPTYTAEEGAYKYYLFDHWDKSGYVNGNKQIKAVYDEFQYEDKCFDSLELSDMRPVQIYALTKLSKLIKPPIKVTDVLTEQDEYSFELGHDFNFEDIPSETIINTRTHFNGTNHIDTGIKLFDEDKDFVIAIDYEFLTGCSPDASLAECYLHNGSKGFRLSYSGSAKVIWSGADCNVAGINKREMLILRHVKGETGLHVYNSNLDEINISTEELTRSFTTKCDNTLIFGASCPELGVYENHAVGNIYWCKIWYKDLGHELCKKLAMWTHEKLTMQVCGFNRYYITNQATRCSFSLLATHLLERCKPYNEVTANSGGWAASDLNKFLNNRLYSALPDPIKLLVKQVSVKSSIGDKSLETMASECYINIPSLLDVDISYKDTSPYNEEVNSKTVISYITDKEVRKRAFDNGETYSYWLRSPNATNNTNTSYYVWYVKADGTTNGLGTPTTENGVVIEMSF